MSTENHKGRKCPASRPSSTDFCLPIHLLESLHLSPLISVLSSAAFSNGKYPCSTCDDIRCRDGVYLWLVNQYMRIYLTTLFPLVRGMSTDEDSCCVLVVLNIQCTFVILYPEVYHFVCVSEGFHCVEFVLTARGVYPLAAWLSG